MTFATETAERMDRRGKNRFKVNIIVLTPVLLKIFFFEQLQKNKIDNLLIIIHNEIIIILCGVIVIMDDDMIT